MNNQYIEYPPRFNIQPEQPIQLENEILLFGKKNNQGKIYGPCRLILKNNKIIQGIFQNGISKKAILYDKYGSWMQGPITQQFQISGNGTIYNYQSYIIYSGNIQSNMRNGLGCEYDSGNYYHTMKGIWENNKKNGQFIQIFDENKQQILEGRYQNNKKQGLFKLQNQNDYLEILFKDGINLEEYNSLKNDQNKENQIQSSPKNKIISQYGFIIYENQILKSRNSHMLDTSVVSIWSHYLMECLQKYKKQYRIYLFGTDLIENYAGVYLQFKNYENIWYQTKHLQNNFSLVSGFYRIIMFPVCYGCHFVLGVIKIQKKNGLLQFTYYYYDSLHGYGQNIMQVIKSYLLNQLEYKYELNNKQMIKRAIQKMKQMKVQNPRQQDGISCGVFISKFMYQICIKSNHNQMDIQDNFNKQEVKKFRNKMMDDITKKLNPFDINYYSIIGLHTIIDNHKKRQTKPYLNKNQSSQNNKNNKNRSLFSFLNISQHFTLKNIG